MQDMASFVHQSAAIALRAGELSPGGGSPLTRTDPSELVKVFPVLKQLGCAIEAAPAANSVKANLSDSFREFLGWAHEVNRETIALHAESRAQRVKLEQNESASTALPSGDAFSVCRLPSRPLKMTLAEITETATGLKALSRAAEEHGDAHLKTAVSAAAKWAAHQFLLRQYVAERYIVNGEMNKSVAA